MRPITIICIVLSVVCYVAAGFLASMWIFAGLHGGWALVCSVAASVLLAIVLEWTDLDFRLFEERTTLMARQRNQARAEAASLEVRLRMAEAHMKRARLLN